MRTKIFKTEWVKFHTTKLKSKGDFVRERYWWVSNTGKIKCTTNFNDREYEPSVSFTGGTGENNYLALSQNYFIEKYVHRLVARFFIPNPLNRRCVNHKDGNKANNHFSNLEWCTHRQNALHYHGYENYLDY